MADIKISIPDESFDRIIEGISTAAYYDQYISEAEEKITKEDFAKKVITDFIKNTVSSVEGNREAEKAKESARQDMAAISISTEVFK